MNKKILRECLRIAKEKNHRHPEKENGKFFHTSFVIHDGTIICSGYNRSHTPVIHMGYAARMRDDSASPKTHSEITAWKRGREIIGDQSFQMVNIRLNNHGECKISEPCQVCAYLLPILGCTGVYYTNTIGGWSKLVR